MSSNQQPPNLLYPVANAVSSSNPFVEKFDENRAPTADDVNYPIQKKWFDKSTNKEWILVGFSTSTGQLQADWRRTSEPIEFIGGTGTAGTFPVSADNNGDILLQSTDLSILITGGTNSLDFTTNGSVIVESFAVDAITAPGVNPVTPNAGLVTVGGDVVAAHSVPVETRSRSLHEYNIEVQYSSAIAATDGTKVGLAAFDSARFTCDANGFVSINGSGVGETITGDTGGPLSPLAGNWDILGDTIPAGTTPVITNGLGNTLTVNVQRSQALAASDPSKIGLCNFNSANFTVDANGFVTSLGSGFVWTDTSGTVTAASNNGYFITGTCTSTLPASPSQGDVVRYFVDTTQILTITAAGSQVIRMGNNVTAAGGTCVNTQRGDSITLIYRSSNTQWCCVDSPTGAWTLT